jgi:hypothetical protein
MRYAMTVVLAAGLLAGCVSGVKAKPRVGLGMSHSDAGSFVGADLGEYGPGDVEIKVEPFPTKAVLIGVGILAATMVGAGVLAARRK